MSYTGHVDGYPTHRCDPCGKLQVLSRGFRDGEAVEFGGRVYIVDLCGDCDEGHALAWLTDRFGPPAVPAVEFVEGCPHCGAPSCDCVKEEERLRFDESVPPWLRGVA